MFEVKPYTAENYDELCGWWAQWEWAAVPEMFLPQDGIIVSHNGVNICAVFIYITNTPVCWIENYISRKDADKEIRDAALDLLVESAITKAAECGARMVMSCIRHASLGRRLEKGGFVVSDSNMAVYMRGL